MHSPALLVHATEVGERRVIPLVDGSELRLNTQSRVEVRYTRTVRELRLLEGEATFLVAHDEERPFRVYVDGAVVQAVGTQFNIYRRRQEATVCVTEGRVHVWTAAAADSLAPRPPTSLSAGGEAALRWQGQRQTIRVRRHAPETLRRCTGWVDGWLEFLGVPLEQVVEQFNRHQRQQLVIVDRALRSKRVGGRLETHDLEGLLELLDRTYDIEATPVKTAGAGTIELRRK